jgi:hypothetical protein
VSDGLDAIRWLFRGAAVYGVLALLPMYFDPPAGLSHPLFYYGFIGVALAWQLAFWLIAMDPVRYRLVILPGIVEKLGFGVAAAWLWWSGRLGDPLLALGGALDLVMAAAFAWAYLRLGHDPASTSPSPSPT